MKNQKNTLKVSRGTALKGLEVDILRGISAPGKDGPFGRTALDLLIIP
jgi:hypothetical protein